VIAVLVFALALVTTSLASAERNPIEPTAAMTVTLILDKSAYLSGDTAVANAIVYRTPAPSNYTYTWRVRDFFGRVLNQTASGTARFTYAIPLDRTGFLSFEVTADDGQGLSQDARQDLVLVSRAVVSINLDRADFNPGDAITASYSVASHVIVSPTYDYTVIDGAGTTVLSGNTTNVFFSFRTPNPSSRTYLFQITARQGANSSQAQVSISQANGFVLGVTFDRTTYTVGETIHAHLTLTSRGTATLPAQFRWTLTLGSVSVSAITNNPQADLSLAVPQGLGSGAVLVGASESNTVTIQFQTVRIGTTNALWSTEIAGIPAFAVLLGLLFILLFAAFIGLWRRVTGGRMGGFMPPAGGPPPPPQGSALGPPSSPMSVLCKHCGKSIDLTTSKRPIEVMCPNCGETQLVT
jgi:DNA-directed RNA polymerase subunit RPC12/RpoP